MDAVAAAAERRGSSRHKIAQAAQAILGTKFNRRLLRKSIRGLVKESLLQNNDGRYTLANKRKAKARARAPSRGRHWVRVKGFDSNPQGEWMVDATFTPTEKSKFVAKIITALGFGPECRIHIPGVGQSHLAHDLIAVHGFRSVVVSDVDDGAIEYQGNLLDGSAEIVAGDDLLADTGPLHGRHFDIVVDSSVSDVFIANGGIKKARRALQSRLDERGAMIVLSMNHRRMLPTLVGFDSFSYAAIEQYSGSRRNPRNLRKDVAVFVASKREASGFDSGSLPTHKALVTQPGGRKWLRDPAACELTFHNALS